MKFKSILLFTGFVWSIEASIQCDSNSVYSNVRDFSTELQKKIDKASNSKKPVVYLDPGIYSIHHSKHIILRKGVSLKGDPKLPTILTVNSKKSAATIEVSSDNAGWSIQDIVFDNVNIEIKNNKNEDETSILGNVFLNGGRGSVQSVEGVNLFIDGNIFLRDQLHEGKEKLPSYNTTNTGVLFQTQKNSVISNNIFGMDLRELEKLEPVVPKVLSQPLNNLKFIHKCLKKPKLLNEQGYIASGVQLYGSNDITIEKNILNATYPDTKYISQDHAISVVGSNQTYVLQNFIAGWQIADFGGAVRFTSAVDGYVISNYLANTGVYLFAAVHADYKQVSNMIVYNNFLYKFLGPQQAPIPPDQDGWLYSGVSFFDFYTARLNYTIRPPIWNSSVPTSPWGWHIVVSSNRFASSPDVDPDVISLGNLDQDEALVDRKNCYINPFSPSSSHPELVPIVWKQQFEGLTKLGSKIPKKAVRYTSQDLLDQVPAQLRRLSVPDYWKAFVLRNNTIPMLSPDTECIQHELRKKKFL